MVWRFSRLIWIVKLEKLRGEVILELVMVPKDQEYGSEADQHPLHAADIWQEIEGRVAVARNSFLIQIHLNGYVHSDIRLLFVGHHRLLLHLENRVIIELCHIIQVYNCILEDDLSGAYLEGDSLLYLRVNGNPDDFALSDDWLWIVVASVKPDLIVK